MTLISSLPPLLFPPKGDRGSAVLLCEQVALCGGETLVWRNQSWFLIVFPVWPHFLHVAGRSPCPQELVPARMLLSRD